ENGSVVKKVRVPGGEATTLYRGRVRFGLSWAPDDTIVLGAMEGPLLRIPAAGGEAEAITRLDHDANEVSHRLPHVLPDGSAVLFTVLRHAVDIRDAQWLEVWALSLKTGERSRLIEGGSDARYVSTGHLLFAREGRVMAAPFDRSRLEVTGPAVPVLEGVGHCIYANNTGNDTGAAQFTTSGTGILAYAAGSVLPEFPNSPVWIDREGNEVQIEAEPRNYLSARVSPEGDRLLLGVPYVPRSAAWLYDTKRAMMRRQTFEGMTNYAVWGPGPDRLSFVSNREGQSVVYSVGVDAGPGSAEPMDFEIEHATGTRRYLAASSSSPDGEHLAVVSGLYEQGGWNFDIWILSRDGRREPFLTSSFNEAYPDFSPDGRWITYVSYASGTPQVYVRRYPDTGTAVQISKTGGRSPLWSRDGREILYRYEDVFYSVALEVDADRIIPAEPEPLFEKRCVRTYPVRCWDVGPDGRALLLVRPAAEEREALMARLHPDRVRVVQNWFAELD
ncbi:MAG: TolB family protein, partial [Planctomycetota bacterium]